MKTSSPKPAPEVPTMDELTELERTGTWEMIWDHYREADPAMLLAWLDQGQPGELALRRFLVVKTWELHRAWSRKGGEPDQLVEAFQSLYPVTGEELDSARPELSPANERRLSDWADGLLT